MIVNVQSHCSNVDSLETFVDSVTKPFDLPCLSQTILHDDEISKDSHSDGHFKGWQQLTRGDVWGNAQEVDEE